MPISFRISAVPAALFILLTLLVLAEGLLAYRDDFLTVSQMRSRGINQGLPLAWHLAIWSDLVLISPLAAYLVHRYWKVWRSRWIVTSLGIGLCVSASLHYLYIQSTMPEALTHDHELTAAGYAHLVYMAIAFSVFLQFFLFTPNVSHGILSLVSVLLLTHVFVGTHMVLGLLNVYFPQSWYPGQPLKSFVGWFMLACLAAGLLWRNYHEIDRMERWPDIEAYPARHPFWRKAAAVFEFWSLQKFDTTERFLKALDYIASYVGVSAFTTVFLTKVQLSSELNGGVFRLENWISFIQSTALPCLLILLFGSIYLLGRHSVRMELAIGNKLFPADRVPTDWGTPKVRVIAVVTVIAHLLLFLSLTWFADNILIASLIMLLSAINDWRTRYLIGDGISKYFSDPKYAPRPDEKDYAVILERRVVACSFLFDRPHLIKETLRVAGCALASALSLFGYANSTGELNTAAYFVLIGTLVVNEIITVRWRVKMFLEMKSIDDRGKTVEAKMPIAP